MENICRTCLSMEGELVSLLSNTSCTAKLLEKIMNISTVVIDKPNDFPYMICRKCILLVEAFFCFKKQIKSVDIRIKNAWRQRCKEFEQATEKLKEIADCSGKLDESGDSDYEVEYISEEVKKDVEDAFRRKEENQHINRLAEACTSLQKVQDISLVTHECTINDKKGKQTRVTTIDCSNEIINKDNEDFYLSKEKKMINTKDSDAKKDKNAFEEIERITLEPEKVCHSKVIASRTVNPCSINEKVFSPTRKSENIAHNIVDCCKHSGSNNAVVTIDPEKSDNANQTSLESDQSHSEGKKESLVHENLDNMDKENRDLGRPNYDNIVKVAKDINLDIEEQKHVEICERNCGKKEKGTEIEIGEKNFEPDERNCENQDKSMEIEMPNDFEEGNLEIDLTDCANSNQSMEVMKPHDVEKKSVKLEPIVAGNLHENINIQIIIEENNCSIKHIDHDYANENLEIETPEKIEVIIPQFKNSDDCKEKQCTETKRPKHDMAVPQLENSNDFKRKQNTYSEKLEDGGMAPRVENADDDDSENLRINTQRLDVGRAVSNSENVKKAIEESEESRLIRNKNSKPFVQRSCNRGKRKLVKKVKPSEDIIVISSDSSDEERYEAFMKNRTNKVNRRYSRNSRTTKEKWFQARDEVAARIHQSWIENKKILKESTNEKNVGQVETKNRSPEKYFQCTSCNINLYSVTAVLYHHNATHTSHEDSLSCHMCEMAFPTRDDLLKHFDQHLESHLYRCLYCSGQFVLKRNLRFHTNCRVGRKLQEPEKKKPRVDDNNLKRNEKDKRKQDVEDSAKENAIPGKP